MDSIERRISYSLDRLAELSDLSVGFLRLEIRRGRLKPVRAGRRVLILQSEVERYLSLNAETCDADGTR